MNISKQILNFWQGNIKLWKAYWIVGELFNGIFMVIIFNIELKVYNNSYILQNLPLIQFKSFSFLSKFLVLFWTIFITIGIWRSAESYRGRFIWIVLTLIILSYRIFILKELFY